MKKKYLKVIFLCTTTFSLVFINSLWAGADPIIDQKSESFRDLQGFSKAPEVIKKAKLDARLNNSEKINGVSLTDEEKDELTLRVKLSHVVGGSIKDAAKKGEITGFAGSYMDTPKGELKIGLTNDDQQRIIMEMIPVELKSRVKFFHADYSLDELQNKMDALNKKVLDLTSSGLEFNDFGISVKDNRIEINIPKESEKVKNDFNKIVDTKYIKFNITEPYKPKSSSDKARPVISGIKVAAFGSGGCTSGYVTYSGVVTAGHWTD